MYPLSARAKSKLVSKWNTLDYNVKDKNPSQPAGPPLTLLWIVKTCFFSEISLTKKVTKLRLVFHGESRYTAILISLTTKSQGNIK